MRTTSSEKSLFLLGGAPSGQKASSGTAVRSAHLTPSLPLPLRCGSGLRLVPLHCPCAALRAKGSGQALNPVILSAAKDLILMNPATLRAAKDLLRTYR